MPFLYHDGNNGGDGDTRELFLCDMVAGKEEPEKAVYCM